MPIFASMVSPSFGLSADGVVVAMAASEGELVTDILVRETTRVCSDVGPRVLYGAYVDAVSWVSPCIGTISVQAS
jgi:hypothetical protein